jgi:hypothetical protein
LSGQKHSLHLLPGLPLVTTVRNILYTCCQVCLLLQLSETFFTPVARSASCYNCQKHSLHLLPGLPLVTTVRNSLYNCCQGCPLLCILECAEWRLIWRDVRPIFYKLPTELSESVSEEYSYVNLLSESTQTVLLTQSILRK